MLRLYAYLAGWSGAGGLQCDTVANRGLDVNILMIAWLLNEEEDERWGRDGLGLNIECGGFIHMFVNHLTLTSNVCVRF